MQTANKRVITGWAMYDWANSVYNLVITTTFFPIYFLGITKAAYGENSVPLFGRLFKNSALYDYTLAIAYLAIACLLPILSSIADSRGNKKSFMQFFCYLGGSACIGLYFFGGEQPIVGLGVGLFALAAIGYVGSLVFYNSYLPEIAAPEDRDRISARGFAMGYIGSVILQLLGFGLVLYFASKGDSTSGPRFTFLMVGLWWMGFAQITFARLPASVPAAKKQSAGFVKDGFLELRKVWLQVKNMPVLKRYLFSFFFYSMGVQTVMLAASVFGKQLLNLDDTKLILTLVVVQLVAIAGAFLIARLSSRFGNLRVLIAVVVLWMAICLGAYFIADAAENGVNAEVGFYLLAAAVGLVMGGIQSLSRSTYSKLMPPTKDTASYFSFYDVTEKVAIVIGLFTFGYIDELIGMKYSVLVLIVFFVVGFFGLIATLAKEKPLTPLIA